MLPQGICARCGKETEELTYKKIENSNRSNYVVVSVEHKYKFQVPICRSCTNEIEYKNEMAGKIGLISIAVLGIIGLLVGYFLENTWVGGGIGAVAGLLIMGVLIDNSEENFAEFDGVAYLFTNPEFRKRFKELNKKN